MSDFDRRKFLLGAGLSGAGELAFYGAALPATWVDITDPDPRAAELDNLAVYKQGIALGAAGLWIKGFSPPLWKI